MLNATPGIVPTYPSSLTGWKLWEIISLPLCCPWWIINCASQQTTILQEEDIGIIDDLDTLINDVLWND